MVLLDNVGTGSKTKGAVRSTVRRWWDLRLHSWLELVMRWGAPGLRHALCLSVVEIVAKATICELLSDHQTSCGDSLSGTLETMDTPG